MCIKRTDFGKEYEESIGMDLNVSNYELLPYTKSTISPYNYTRITLKKPFLSQPGATSRFKFKVPLYILRSDKDKEQEYEKKKQWILRRGYFDFTEYDCKNKVIKQQSGI